MNGDIVGYDPGGDSKHGVARLQVSEGRVVRATAATVETTEQAIRWMNDAVRPIGLGVDTLTVWSTGPAGWRPADRYLREQYPEAKRSILSPNVLFGAMVANGMALVGALRVIWPDLVVSETHPKVLYFALTGSLYDYERQRACMEARLSQWLGTKDRMGSKDENQWDALASAWAVFEGLRGKWSLDLHQLPTSPDERLIALCGPGHYYWPEAI